MHLSKHDLMQMDEDWLKSLPPALLLEVSKRLLADVKTLQDRLNQNPSNSSRPPSSQALWEKPSRGTNAEPTPEVEPEGQEPVSEGRPAQGDSSAPAAAQEPSVKTEGDARRRAGKQPGSPGPSTLKETDPFLLIRTDPASAQ
jgi:hypothetical protein